MDTSRLIPACICGDLIQTLEGLSSGYRSVPYPAKRNRGVKTIAGLMQGPVGAGGPEQDFPRLLLSPPFFGHLNQPLQNDDETASVCLAYTKRRRPGIWLTAPSRPSLRVLYRTTLTGLLISAVSTDLGKSRNYFLRRLHVLKTISPTPRSHQ